MNLTERLENLLAREAEWLEETLAWYADLGAAMDDESYDDIVTAVDRHGNAIASFSREREILEKEMRNGGAAALPESLRPLASQVAALAQELQSAQNAAAEETAGAAQRIKAELGSLQRGRGVLDGYRAGGDDGVPRLDRKG